MHTDTTRLYEVTGADFGGYPKIYVSAGDFADLHHVVEQLHPGTTTFRARRLPADEAQRLAAIPVEYAAGIERTPRDQNVEIEYSVDNDQYVLEPFPLWKVAAALGHAEGDETPIDIGALVDSYHDVTERWAQLLQTTRPAKRVHIYDASLTAW
ncbi:hypothetical protein [Amycolatopsis kentuckyensis]|uniref:hypothetical protein n=1 Tax=Amycolatopsis kentuckyensis TaxID=218823 RepID=UPI0035656F43